MTNRKDDYICGTGTVFNQEILSCDYPDNVDCAASSTFYSANSEFGKAGQPEPSGDGGQGAAARPKPAGGQRPTPQQTQEPDYGGAEEPQYTAPRPAAPAPKRPKAPPAARPPPPAAQPDYRPAAGGSRPSIVARPKTAPRPAQRPAPAPVQRPSKARPRPVDRPVQQLNDQPLDYEPSQVVQRRVARHNQQQQRWTVMSRQY